MLDRTLLVFLMLGLAPVMTGCTAMRSPHAADASGESDDDGWLVGARRRIAQAAREIEADMNFHENEGLDAFAPDAADQVHMLRGDMNGSTGITR